MKRTSVVTFAVLLLSSLSAIAQNPPQMPKPGAEQKNLNYFVGTWKETADVKPGPMGPGGKYTDTQHVEWMPGGFFLLSHMQGSSAMGKVVGIAVYGYDAQKKVYTYDEFNNDGEAVHATGTFDGKVWSWTSDSPMGGQTMKGHFLVTATSPTAYNFKFETSMDGGANWTTFMEGSATKAASTGAATKK